MPCQGKQSGWRVENLWEMAKHSTPRLIPSPWKSLIGVFFIHTFDPKYAMHSFKPRKWSLVGPICDPVGLCGENYWLRLRWVLASGFPISNFDIYQGWTFPVEQKFKEFPPISNSSPAAAYQNRTARCQAREPRPDLDQKSFQLLQKLQLEIVGWLDKTFTGKIIGKLMR